MILHSAAPRQASMLLVSNQIGTERLRVGSYRARLRMCGGPGCVETRCADVADVVAPREAHLLQMGL